MNIFDWMPEKAPSSPNLVEVAFKHRRRAYFRNDRKLHLMAGDDIIVGVQNGMDFGHITMTGELVQLRARSSTTYRRVIRVANSTDRKRHQANRKSEAEALQAFRSAARKRKIELKPIDAEWQHDRKRITFYYTTNKKRLATKALLSELRRRFKTRVYVRRISGRQGAQRIGGIGSCGRELCCSSWMLKMPKVTMDAAKKQDLPLPMDRLRGQCNQLKCCLNYELEQYVEALRDFPRTKDKVGTEAGTGIVEKVNIFAKTVKVIYPDRTIVVLPLEAITIHPAPGKM